MSDVAEAHVLIAGSGPAGLAVARSLSVLGVRFRLIDRTGVAGGAYNRIHPGITLASPTRYTGLPGLAVDWLGEYITAPQYRDYLRQYAAVFELRPEPAELESLQRAEGCFVARFRGVSETSRYEAVVACTGMFDFPVWPQLRSTIGDASGGPRILHARDWPGPASFAGERLLIVGAATSGVELAEECARAGLSVAISARGGKPRLAPQKFLGRDLHDYARILESVPPWLLGSYCDRRPTLPGTDLGFSAYWRQGKIRITEELLELDGRRARFRGGKEEELDAVVMATGYRFEMPFLPPEVARSSTGSHPLASGGESRTWPGLFFVGTPCAGGFSSEFLRGIARDAPAVAGRVAELVRARHASS